ncbi:hypothetical protein FRC07_008769, partial [Ceratobasidium sp. 392]
SSGDEFAMAIQFLPSLTLHAQPKDNGVHTLLEAPNPMIFAFALLFLCRAQSTELQDFYRSVIIMQPVPKWSLDMLELADSQNLLEQLCRAVIDADTSVLPIAAAHFGLLVASTIVASSYHGRLDGHLTALRLLMNLCGEYSMKLDNPSPLSEETIFARLSENIEDGSTFDHILPTMQSVVDFCEAGFNHSIQESNHRLDHILIKLEQLKDSYKPGAAKVIRSTSPVQEGSAPATVQATRTSKADPFEAD